MRRKTLQSFILAGIAVVLAISPLASQVEKIPADPAIVDLVNRFLAGLQLPEDKDRIAAIIPLVHRSLLNTPGTDLFSSVKQFSYKKAAQNVKFYDVPARIHEVHKGGVQAVGPAAGAERGQRHKYFIKKKEGGQGMPAPIHVFIPEKGGDPKILDFGSL